MTTRAKKLQELLFGKVDKLKGGTPVVANLQYPTLDGYKKTIYWTGAEGIIIHLCKKIESLEKKVEELEINKLNKK